MKSHKRALVPILGISALAILVGCGANAGLSAQCEPGGNEVAKLLSEFIEWQYPRGLRNIAERRALYEQAFASFNSGRVVSDAPPRRSAEACDVEITCQITEVYKIVGVARYRLTYTIRNKAVAPISLIYFLKAYDDPAQLFARKSYTAALIE